MAYRHRLATSKSEEILGLLQHQELYGLEMIRRTTSLNRGTVYTTLRRLRKEGLVNSREFKPKSGRGPARVMYSITKRGQRVLEASRMLRAAWGTKRK